MVCLCISIDPEHENSILMKEKHTKKKKHKTHTHKYRAEIACVDFWHETQNYELLMRELVMKILVRLLVNAIQILEAGSRGNDNENL